ncbi:30S ribosomal protein S20 [Buchnera aphidicola str. Bp (Baizongia pistaciae)]|uniref:Small ribosomal subunit protein bS20 n=1 Tax=Buchnera aphidicola subsp. Baizongia pistaciae (strain Bp) TaxID=224915 RepID=RS20_BUCBP|nr:30S ribosomal protein S20 [Buchnera aphidicola]Q89AU8.1 RecName: Full=Small ribosomal subunit protein bS20; AltName: Full=30S ribosomal protein S20 [Buchnera aphidicola str. Bp (Baizongia pistaciae)]AAO26874.1 30S ribosomal protein S20 [Buchnera aphidicola str. Bp (Baizongia pistaciae)]
MANIKSSKKDSIKSRKKKKLNASKKSMIKTLIKKVKIAILSGDKLKSELAFSKIQPILDRYSAKGLIHKNKAARHKSNLKCKINAL